MMNTPYFLCCILLSYLIGSVSSAILVCRAFGFPDPRTEGSSNPGATNVLRIAGKKYAIMTLIGDMLKGFIPVFVLRLLHADATALGIIAFASVMGHLYPIFFQFKGGKGVATALGALLGMHAALGGAVIATWLIIALISHYSSLASIISLIFAPFYCFLITQQAFATIPVALTALMILHQHRKNIERLINKTEPCIRIKR